MNDTPEFAREVYDENRAERERTLRVMSDAERERNMRVIEPFIPRKHQPPEPSPMATPKPDDLGRMTAEAALKQHEVTAEAIEAMGNELRDRINKLNTAMGDCDLVLKEVAETANAIRDRGKHVHAQIDEAMSLAKAIRDACAEFRKKVS